LGNYTNGQFGLGYLSGLLHLGRIYLWWKWKFTDYVCCFSFCLQWIILLVDSPELIIFSNYTCPSGDAFYATIPPLDVWANSTTAFLQTTLMYIFYSDNFCYCFVFLALYLLSYISLFFFFLSLIYNNIE
jgi:hypothetical protein